MILNESEITILNCLYSAGATGVSVRDLVAGYLPGHLTGNASASSYLCRLRGKGMALSELRDGANLWTLTDAGMTAIRDAAAAPKPDISATREPAIPEPIHGLTVDISADIPEGADAETIATALEEFNALGMPFCADMDPAGVSDALVEEANSLRMGSPFPRLKSALYVLAVLADFIGDRPAMVHELDRIADHLEREAA